MCVCAFYKLLYMVLYISTTHQAYHTSILHPIHHTANDQLQSPPIYRPVKAKAGGADSMGADKGSAGNAGQVWVPPCPRSPGFSKISLTSFSHARLPSSERDNHNRLPSTEASLDCKGLASTSSCLFSSTPSYIILTGFLSYSLTHTRARQTTEVSKPLGALHAI